LTVSGEKSWPFCGNIGEVNRIWSINPLNVSKNREIGRNQIAIAKEKGVVEESHLTAIKRGYLIFTIFMETLTEITEDWCRYCAQVSGCGNES
jgi:hypothetical protein